MSAPDFNQQLQEARNFMAARKYPDGLKLYAALSRQSPQAELWDEYGRAAALAGDYELATRLFEKVLELDPNNAAVALRLAGEFGKMWLFAKARALSIRAAELAPGNFAAQLNLASFLARTGAIDEAREAVNKSLALDSSSEQARYLSAHLDRRANKPAQAETQIRDLLASSPRDPQVALFCHFELARLLDKTGRFDEAMAMLAEGKRLAALTINVAAAEKSFDDRRERAVRKARSLSRNTLELWSQSFPAEARTALAPLAFVGGHARSGTTLLERILDAHPAVSACDESLAFQTIAPLVDVNAPSIPAAGLNFLRQRYLKNLTIESGPPGGKIIIDKNPPATAYLPAFLRAFPELRALIALRDPRDVLISCYFESLAQVSHFSLERLAQHYSCIMEVWLAVREWDGLAWTEIRYEDLVADALKEGGRVTKFLGLEWHENQGRFHEVNREKPVMSTNYTDVTQPVYQRSVGRWQVYEKFLAPIFPMLEPYCKKFGYA